MVYNWVAKGVVVLKFESFENHLIMLIFLCMIFNASLNNKFLDWSKLKAFADDKINVAQMAIFIFETLWESEKMLVTSIFSFSHNVFENLLFPGH